MGTYRNNGPNGNQMGYWSASERSDAMPYGSYSLPEDAPDNDRSFFKWYDENGEVIANVAEDALCLMFPRRSGCSGSYPQDGYDVPTRQDFTLVYVAFGFVLILLLALVIKK